MKYPILVLVDDTKARMWHDKTLYVSLKQSLTELKEDIARQLLACDITSWLTLKSPEYRIVTNTNQYNTALEYLINQAFVVEEHRQWHNERDVFVNYIYDDTSKPETERRGIAKFDREFQEALKFAINSEKMDDDSFSYSDDIDDTYQKQQVVAFDYYLTSKLDKVITVYHFDDTFTVRKLIKKQFTHPPKLRIRVEDSNGEGIAATVKVKPENHFTKSYKTDGEEIEPYVSAKEYAIKVEVPGEKPFWLDVDIQEWFSTTLIFTKRS